MAEKVYLVTVTAHGLTSNHEQRADDLLDAVVKAREMQAAGLARIQILLTREGAYVDYPWST